MSRPNCPRLRGGNAVYQRGAPDVVVLLAVRSGLSGVDSGCVCGALRYEQRTETRNLFHGVFDITCLRRYLRGCVVGIAAGDKAIAAPSESAVTQMGDSAGCGAEDGSGRVAMQTTANEHETVKGDQRTKQVVVYTLCGIAGGFSATACFLALRQLPIPEYINQLTTFVLGNLTGMLAKTGIDRIASPPEQPPANAFTANRVESVVVTNEKPSEEPKEDSQ